MLSKPQPESGVGMKDNYLLDVKSRSPEGEKAHRLLFQMLGCGFSAKLRGAFGR